MCFIILNLLRLLLAFLSCVHTYEIGVRAGTQEYSSRTLGATWGIISAIMVPIAIILICIGWRLLLRRKQEEREENEFLAIKSRPIDPDESMKINSDDDSIPYKKDSEDTPEPTDPVRVAENYSDPVRVAENYSDPVRVAENYAEPVRVAEQPFTYGQVPAPAASEFPPDQSRRQWAGETEIN